MVLTCSKLESREGWGRHFLVCFILMCGRVNVYFGLSISWSRIWMWVIVLGLKLFLIFIILVMKWLLAILDICMSDVMMLFSCIIFLGGALVQVLVNSLTVVQSLFMLLTSGLISVLLLLALLSLLLLLLLLLLLSTLLFVFV